MDEELGCYVIGQVRANACGPVPAHESCNIDGERVALNNLEPFRIVRGDLEKRRKAARIALNRNNFSRTFGKEGPRETAGTWANLDDCRMGKWRGGACDAPGEIEIEQKILAQGFFR
jgi:hypothetical protein